MDNKKKNMRRLIPIAIVLLLVCGFLAFTARYYHANADADAAMVSDETVQVIPTDYGWLFDGEAEEDALILYPGGKVEAAAYAPLCKELAHNGMDVCLVEMPLRLAFFGLNKADAVMRTEDYAHWYLAGHSLGGAIAAIYAAGHADQLDGLVLLAAYSTKQLDDGLPTTLIYGSEDTVLSMEKYRENLANVPHRTECVIQGGNHAQFGSYGAQAGDGDALISQEQQVEETVTMILKTQAVQ